MENAIHVKPHFFHFIVLPRKGLCYQCISLAFDKFIFIKNPSQTAFYDNSQTCCGHFFVLRISLVLRVNSECVTQLVCELKLVVWLKTPILLCVCEKQHLKTVIFFFFLTFTNKEGHELFMLQCCCKVLISIWH